MRFFKTMLTGSPVPPPLSLPDPAPHPTAFQSSTLTESLEQAIDYIILQLVPVPF